MGEYLEYVVCLIGTFVAEEMKKDEAMLLPNLYRDIIHELHSHKASFPQVNTCEIDIPSCHWFLSHLHTHFDNVLEVQCKHKCYGTLIYHKNCDLVHALSLALGTAETRSEKAKMPDLCTSKVQLPSLDQQLRTVAVYLNNKLHRRANQLYNEAPESIANLDISGVLHETNSELLNFLSVMTQPARQSRRKLFQMQCSHTRNVRLYYALICAGVLYQSHMLCATTRSYNRSSVMPWRYTTIG